MKSIEEIKESENVLIGQIGEDGFNGIICLNNWRGSLICSTGAGWDHVSVAPENLSVIPSWEDMCEIKDIFFKSEETVIQIHPPKDQYVNNMPNCLHLWRCNYKEMVLPPSCLVGLRVGQTFEEFNAEVREAYKIAGEVF